MTMIVRGWYNSMLCETVIKTLFMGQLVGEMQKQLSSPTSGASLKQAGLCEVAVFEVSEMHCQSRTGRLPQAHPCFAPPTILCFSDKIA